MFGAARGFLICVIGWVFLNWLLQGRIRNGPSRPVRGPREHRQQLITMLPDNPEGLLQQLRNGAPEGEPAEPAEPDPQRPGQPPQQPQRRS